jgi:NAD(P)H-quinone oxidoreductase subunit 5
VREFGLIFGGKPKEMSVRSPEVLWPMVVPMTLMLGVALHLPIILQSLSLLPNWAELNKDAALLLFWSSLSGIALGVVCYLTPLVQKPIQFPVKSIQQLLTFDFYTQQLYKSTVVFGVASLSKMTDLVDRYIVDGLINAVGWASLFGGESLKYSNSGQSQFYVLTILLGISVIGVAVAWSSLTAGIF